MKPLSFKYLWAIRILTLLLAYTGMRLYFYLSNTLAFATIPQSQVLEAFVVGLRFDLSSVMTLTAPVVVADILATHLLKAKARLQRTISGLLFHVLYAAHLTNFIISVADAKMYRFTNRRTNLDLFASIGVDIKAQAPGLLLQFWPTVMASFGVFALLCWFLWNPKIFLNLSQYGQDGIQDQHLPVASSKIKSTLLVLSFLALSFLAVRGGWQRKPLGSPHAFTYQPSPVAHLILNPVMSLLKAPPSDGIQRRHDFQDQASVKRRLAEDMVPIVSRLPIAGKKNVVVIIVESLASEYVGAFNKGKGYTPFLDWLVERSVWFRESFANGRRSIDAMPAIFASIPAWREPPYITSSFSGNRIVPLPRTLKDYGYESFFFHGAANGSMHFDVFAQIAGFDHYVGLNEYPPNRPRDIDGQWGVYDEPFLKWSVETLSASKRPFLAGLFTLSSHNPFTIPDDLRGRFPKGTLPIHESIGYADYSLAKFFESAEKQPWYKDTIFIITGDHTSLSDQPQYQNYVGRFRVPIILYAPDIPLPSIGSSKIASHVDIAPTLLDLLGIDTPDRQLFGASLFEPSFPGRFVQWDYGFWHLRDDLGTIRIQEVHKSDLEPDHDHDDAFLPADLNHEAPLKKEDLERYSVAKRTELLKAYRQYFLNGLLDNDWLYKSEKSPQH
jgi:arylsulfatase A-like enzyme